MPISSIKVGDKVYLTSNVYTPSQTDPVKGSIYECKGTICEMQQLGCSVQWDTGYTNNYIAKRDLTLTNSFCDDYKSIW